MEEEESPILPFNYKNIYANAPEPPLMPKNFYIVRGNNYKNRVYEKTEQVDCINNLKSFEQYSGQCWSDAASIFLLFSKEVGELTQNFLASKEPIDDFAKWCYRNKEFIEEIRGLPFLSYDEFEQFVFFSSVYLDCLKDRFDKWNADRNNVSEATTCKLISFSYCQESVGILAGAILNFSGLTWRRIQGFASREGIPLRDYFGRIMTEYTEVYKNNNLKKADILDKFFLRSLGVTSRGYDNREFGKVIAIYLKFLKKDIEFETEKKYLIARFTEESDKSFYSYEAVASINNFIDVSLVNTIHSTYSTHDVNMSAQLKVGKGWHAITFLTCENDQQIIYDNNRGELVEAYWRELYKSKENYRQFYLFHNDMPAEEKRKEFNKLVEIIRSSPIPEDPIKRENHEKILLELELFLSFREIVIFFNPAIICMAYNPKTFTLTCLKKHIAGRNINKEVIVLQYESDIFPILSTAMVWLEKVGVSIHLLANIPFVYFTPKAVYHEVPNARNNGSQLFNENGFKFGNELTSLFESAPNAPKKQSAGSRRAKRRAARSRVRRVQKRKTRRQKVR